MTGKISFAILASNSRQGYSLSKELMILLPHLFKVHGFALELKEPIFQGTQYDMLKATLECDLVIFDASVEWNLTSGFDSNYFAATANPISDDRILVVSRTKLPINFVPMRCNIPMLGDEEKYWDEKGILRSKYNYSNEEIIEWLKREIAEMIKEKRIPKATEMKLSIPPFEQLATVGSKLTTYIEKNSFDSLDYMKQKVRGKRGAFISYRSRYSQEQLNGIGVMDLVDCIRTKHNDPDYPVLFYADGDISKEFMTEQRRWEVVSFVDRRLREVEEVWIFNSYPAENTDPKTVSAYLDSWWTQGEILALMYIKAGSPKDLPGKIFVFDPHTGKAEEKGADFIPDLDDGLLQEIARYYSNSDSLSSGNESMGNMRLLRNTNGILRRLAFYQMKKIQRKMFSSDSEMSKIADQITYDSYLKSIKSHVYDLSFTANRVAACPNCQCKQVRMEDFRNRSFILDYIKTNSDDPKDIKEINQRGFFNITETALKVILNNKKWECPQCKAYFVVEHRPDNNQYRWWPIRMGQKTGPEGVLIEKIPVYEIVSS